MTGRFLQADACPICRSRDIKPWKKGTFAYEGLSPDQIKITDSDYGKIWDLSVCGRCGHVFADPSPEPEFLSALYGKVEDPLYDQEADGRRRNFRPILDRLDELKPSHGESEKSWVLLRSEPMNGSGPKGCSGLQDRARKGGFVGRVGIMLRFQTKT